MIQVNLLPVELRKPEGTPMARFLIIIGDVLMVCAATFVFLWLRGVQLPAAEKERMDLVEKVKVKQGQAAKYDKLMQAKRNFEQRKNTFERLSGERVLWAKKLAQLSRIVGAQPAWLADLKVSSSKGAKGGSANKIATRVWIAGRDERKYTSFQRSLYADLDYWGAFQRMTDPGLQLSRMVFTRKEGDRVRKYTEEKFFTFNLEQFMKEVGLPEAPKSPRRR